MNAFACFDIETIPNPALPAECVPAFDESTVALGNLVDPAKIDKKLKEARAKFEASLPKIMSLDRDLCMVCSFCGCEVSSGHRTYTSPEVATTDEEEFLVLREAIYWLSDCLNREIPIITFNGASFDLPVLFRRAMYEDISIPSNVLTKLCGAHRLDRNPYHIDLMQALGMRNPFSGKPEFRGLDYYLRRFGLGSKTAGMDGSMVYPLWQEGKYQEIASYCRDDVDRTADLFERVAPWLPVFQPISYSFPKKEIANVA